MDVILKPITQTLEENYMPYAMSVIVSRAIPEIDGFKPTHRKLLYTMYKMGLLTGGRTKSANIVGQTMRLNPHGDSAIYETMVRLTRGYDALLHPFVDSKGNFGKHFSRDMAYAASRYTEAKLDGFCSEIFADIDKNVVDFVDNYDSTTKEPELLPVTFPNILVSPNQGIAVGMASNICSFNLSEICATTVELIKNKDHDLLLTLSAPDFTTGGEIIYEPDQMRSIYENGVGSFKIRGKYVYDKKNNCVIVKEIPYTTTVEAIIDKIAELVKDGKVKEISDIRDETDFSGMKIAIDLKRGVDPEKLMQKLFKTTTLEDSFPCNFNVLIEGAPKVLGVRSLIFEWLKFRHGCLKRGISFDIKKKKDRLHLLEGLGKILLDIDKAISIIRGTEDDGEVVPNHMIGIGIDEIQAEFVADIKLRNLNKNYILSKLSETETLKKEISELEAVVDNPRKIDKIIIKQLENISKKYGKPRKTTLLYKGDVVEYTETEEIDDYQVSVFVTKEGYLKKITPQSLRMSGEQKLKEGDSISSVYETSNACDLIVFTDKGQAYKTKVYEFEDTKASALGEFLPQKLSFDKDENVVFAFPIKEYRGSVLAFFENGKCARIDLSAYETKSNRKKLINAYSLSSPLVAMFYIREETEFVCYASNNRALIISTASISPKTTKSTAGVNVMTLKKGKTHLAKVVLYQDGLFEEPAHYRTKNIPAAGCFLRKEDAEKNQITLF